MATIAQLGEEKIKRIVREAIDAGQIEPRQADEMVAHLREHPLCAARAREVLRGISLPTRERRA